MAINYCSLKNVDNVLDNYVNLGYNFNIMKNNINKISLSDNFDYKKLLRFTLPSIGMMVFTSIYSVVDGLFVSNIVGKSAFASLNLVMPFLLILGGVGAMVGTGGSALVAVTLGEGKDELARRYFSMLIKLELLVGIIFSIIGVILMPQVSLLLGATPEMLEDCVVYGRTILIFNAAMQLQYMFQGFMIVAEQPGLGLRVTVIAGVSNMIMDAIFVAGLDLGIVGAALATGLSQFIGAAIPFMYFIRRDNDKKLYIIDTKIDYRPIAKVCTNGMSEMLNLVSGSIIGMMYNSQLMSYAGADGVAAFGVIMYVAYIFIAIFMGYSTGSAPIVGYNYGADNMDEVKNVIRISLKIVGVTGVVMTAFSILFAEPLSSIFVGYDKGLLALTTKAYTIYSISFLIMGFNIYVSSFFTALNNGLISAIISFLRSFVLQAIMILVLPMIWGIDGIWAAVIVAEVISLIVSGGFLLGNRKKYNY